MDTRADNIWSGSRDRSSLAGPGPLASAMGRQLQSTILPSCEWDGKLMKRQIRIAVIVPAGPRDDVLDTLASVVHYSEPSRIIVVVDDTSNLDRSVSRIPDLRAETVVIPAPPKALGSQGGLWVKLAAGYRWVLERYEPRMILRLDADALLIGRGLESRAELAFASDPGVGLLGSYRMGPDGGLRDSSWAARKLRAETGPLGLLRPRNRSSLRHFLALARKHGYLDGESALGGAYIHSYEAAKCIYKNGWFSQPWLASSKLGEDHIMALLTMAAGYRIGDFGGPLDPLALKWLGLPAHPADLLNAGKLVTHSVRSWQDLNEGEIRTIFARARTQD